MENYFLRDEEESMWGTGPEPAWGRRWEQNREKPSRGFIGCWQTNRPPGGSAIKPVNLGLSGKKNFLKLGVIPKFMHVFLAQKLTRRVFCIALFTAF